MKPEYHTPNTYTTGNNECTGNCKQCDYNMSCNYIDPDKVSFDDKYGFEFE